MPIQLRRLLESHEFLRHALREHGHRLASADKSALLRERDQIFLQLLQHSSADPRVTVEQIRILLSSLVELALDTGPAEVLRKTCQEAVDRLASQAAAGKLGSDGVPLPLIEQSCERDPATGLTLRQVALLNSLTDRAAIYGRDYRFLFTNRANADFHGIAAADFIGRTCQSIVGKKCFEQMTKPRLDLCFAGESATMVAAQRRGRSARKFMVSFHPVLDASGRVMAALLVARDMTDIAAVRERDHLLSAQ